MEIPGVYGSFQIIKKDDEQNETNMPNNMIDAVVLFKRTNELKSLENCRDCVDKCLAILAAGPDGKTQINFGYGAVCWDCGHVGLPNNVPEGKESDNTDASLSPTFRPECKKCKSTNANMVQCMQPDGSKLPWIELVDPPAGADGAEAAAPSAVSAASASVAAAAASNSK